MADTTLQLYRKMIPDHGNVDVDVVNLFLEQASLQHSAAAFGVQWQIAMIYYAAHMIQKSPGLVDGTTAGEVGQITMQSDGSVQRQYAQPMIQDSDRRSIWLSTTLYGAAYLGILSTLAATKPITYAQ